MGKAAVRKVIGVRLCSTKAGEASIGFEKWSKAMPNSWQTDGKPMTTATTMTMTTTTTTTAARARAKARARARATAATTTRTRNNKKKKKKKKKKKNNNKNKNKNKNKRKNGSNHRNKAKPVLTVERGLGRAEPSKLTVEPSTNTTTGSTYYIGIHSGARGEGGGGCVQVRRSQKSVPRGKSRQRQRLNKQHN